MQGRKMWQEIITNKDAHKDEVVNNALKVVLERYFRGEGAEFEI